MESPHPRELLEDSIEAFDIIDNDDIEAAKQSEVALSDRRRICPSYLLELIRNQLSAALPARKDSAESAFEWIMNGPNVLTVGHNFPPAEITAQLESHVSYDPRSGTLHLAISSVTALDMPFSPPHDDVTCLLQAVLLPVRSESDRRLSIHRSLDLSGEASFEQLFVWSNVSASELEGSHVELSAWHREQPTLIGMVNLKLSLLEANDGVTQQEVLCYMHKKEGEDCEQVYCTPPNVNKPPNATRPIFSPGISKSFPFVGKTNTSLPRRICSRVFSPSSKRIEIFQWERNNVKNLDVHVPKPRASSWAGPCPLKATEQARMEDAEENHQDGVEQYASQSLPEDLLCCLTSFTAFTSPGGDDVVARRRLFSEHETKASCSNEEVKSKIGGKDAADLQQRQATVIRHRVRLISDSRLVNVSQKRELVDLMQLLNEDNAQLLMGRGRRRLQLGFSRRLKLPSFRNRGQNKADDR